MKMFRIIRENILLVGILLFSALLSTINLKINEYGNTYYAAGVKSMLLSWRNFLFGAFDPSGFVTIDKPPLVLWCQAISAKIFGFNYWSIVLPQIISGVISVLIIYILVKPHFGKAAGLLSALIMSLTPIVVVLNRSNYFESILILVLLCSAWALGKAQQNGKLKWLLLSVGIIGIGFNVKMLQAFIILPAIYITYLFFTPVIKFKKRIINLLIATVVLAVVSSSWLTFVELTPKAQRPYIGSTMKNSAFELAFDYNGINRFNDPTFKEINIRENGKPGILRLFDKNWAGEVSWFLFISLVGVGMFLLMLKNKIIVNEKKRFYFFWILWLVSCYPLFCFISGLAHHYYIVMLAPCIAVLSSITISLLWQYYSKRNWQGWFLPIILFLNSLLQIFFIMRYKDTLSYEKYGNKLIGLILIVSIIGTAAMVTFRYRDIKRNFIYSFTILLIASNLIAPFAWSITPMFYKNDAHLPMVGPELIDLKGTINNIWVSTINNITCNDMEDITRFLNENNKENEKYILATIFDIPASQLMLYSDKPVIVLGGFSGTDNIFNGKDINRFFEKREVRYLLVTKYSRGYQLAKNLYPIISSAKLVPPEEWDPNKKLRSYFELYDCLQKKP